jgi:hypothetical protein
MVCKLHSEGHMLATDNDGYEGSVSEVLDVPAQ